MTMPETVPELVPETPVKRCAVADCNTPPQLVLEDPDGIHEPACYAHAPWLADERVLSARKGGLRFAAKARRFSYLTTDDLGDLESPADAKRWSEVIARSVATGRLSSAAAGIALRAIEQWTRSHEAVELEARVTEVEARLQQADEQRARLADERTAEREARRHQHLGRETT
jgi:hypothetical protein